MSRVILSLENRTWETVQPEIQFRAGGRQDSLQLRPYDSAAPHSIQLLHIFQVLRVEKSLSVDMCGTLGDRKEQDIDTMT